MKRLLALFFSMISLQASASSESDFMLNYANSSKLTRAAQANQICVEIMSLWPSQDYFRRLAEIAQHLTIEREAAYNLYSTCQSRWVTRHLDPSKTKQIKEGHQRINLGLYIASLDFLNTYETIREEVTLFNKVKPESNPQVPPSPYELISNIAASDRQLDETLETQKRKTIAFVAGSATGLVGALKTGIDIFDFTRKTSAVAGRAAKQAILVEILAIAAKEGTELGLWYKRESDLSSDVEKSRALLMNTNFNRSIALDEFYKTNVRLGYFYTYNLYLRDSGAEVHPAASNKACSERLRNFFESQQQHSGRAYEYDRKCKDAASLWLIESLYLSQTFSRDAEAIAVADKLMEKAKFAFWAYEETRKYMDSLPVCVPRLNNVIIRYDMQCIDPKTGNEVI